MPAEVFQTPSTNPSAIPHSQEFQHDVFLSHSAKDKAVGRFSNTLSASIGERAGVRCRNSHLAKRLPVAVRKHLKVWFDEWECPSPAGAGEGGRRPGEGRGAEADSMPAKIEEGPFHFGFRTSDFGFAQPSLSANAFGSDWAQLEAGTCGRRNLRFRDPLNQERRFIPLRLDDTPIKGFPGAIPLHPLPPGGLRAGRRGWKKRSTRCWMRGRFN